MDWAATDEGHGEGVGQPLVQPLLQPLSQSCPDVRDSTAVAPTVTGQYMTTTVNHTVYNRQSILGQVLVPPVCMIPVLGSCVQYHFRNM